MTDLEVKKKVLKKLKTKVDGLLENDHPASDKIEVGPALVRLEISSVASC